MIWKLFSLKLKRRKRHEEERYSSDTYTKVLDHKCRIYSFQLNPFITIKRNKSKWVNFLKCSNAILGSRTAIFLKQICTLSLNKVCNFLFIFLPLWIKALIFLTFKNVLWSNLYKPISRGILEALKYNIIDCFNSSQNTLINWMTPSIHIYSVNPSTSF